MPAAKPSFPRLRLGHPLAQGLVFGAPLYEGGGLAINDLSGQGNNGVVSGGAVWTGGQSGYAMKFDGSTGFVQMPQASVLQPAKAISFGGWFYSIGTTGGNQVCIANTLGTINNNTGYILRLVPTNSLDVDISVAGSLRTITLSGLFPFGQWLHLTVTYDGSTIRAYANGAQVGTFSIVGTIAYPNAGPVIGYKGNGQFLNGYADSAFIYNRALSSTEVAALYQDSWQMYRSKRAIFKLSGFRPFSPIVYSLPPHPALFQ